MKVPTIPSLRGNTPLQVGKLVKQERLKIAYNKTMADVLGHTNKDYLNLKNTEKTVSYNNALSTFAKGLQTFLEKGTMF